MTLTFTQIQLPIDGESMVEVLDACQPERRLIGMAVRDVKVDLSKLGVILETGGDNRSMPYFQFV